MINLFARSAHLRPYHRFFVVVVAIGLSQTQAHAGSLTLDEFVDVVIERDLEIAQAQDGENIMRDSARVAGALPPPNLTLAASNFPVDSFASDQEPMTQLVAKVSQMFPPGDSRRWRSTSKVRSAEVSVAKRTLRAAMLKQQLQVAWAQAAMAYRSVEILEQNRPVFEQALDTTRASYRAGIRQARQREVLGAQTAITRLNERIERFQMMGDSTRETFGEWLTINEINSLEFTGDSQSSLIESSRMMEPMKHPLIALVNAQRDVADADQRLATELGKGSRGISLSYGYRDDPSGGMERADFLSLGFTMDLASLQGNTNSARRAAASAKVDQADKEIELQRSRLLRDYAKLTVQGRRLRSRQSLLRDDLLPQYRQQAEATRRAFASNEARFIEVQLVLMDLLNAELDALALDTELIKNDAALEYVLTTVNQSEDAS